MYFSDKQLRGASVLKQKEMLLSVGVDWENMADAYKYGVFVKKERVEHVTTDAKGNVVKTMHSRIVAKLMQFDKFTKENEEFLCNKWL